MKVHEWLQGFLVDLHEAFHPADWPDIDTEAYDAFHELFRKAFARHGVSEAEAREALVVLADAPPKWKAEAIEKTIAAVKAIRDLGRAAPSSVATSAPLVFVPDRATVEASRGCPECTREPGRGKPPEATGWAQRRAAWHSIPRPFVVELFCRCPMGRWRRAHDVELLRGERVRQHDDLQARPELWDLEANHQSWSWRSTTHDLVMPEGTDGLWRYYLPGEVAPEPIAPAALAGRVSDDMTPSRRRYPEDLGKVEPAVPIPPRPSPVPAREVPVSVDGKWDVYDESTPPRAS